MIPYHWGGQQPANSITYVFRGQDTYVPWPKLTKIFPTAKELIRNLVGQIIPSTVRAEEVEAISQAVGILNDDDALDRKHNRLVIPRLPFPGKKECHCQKLKNMEHFLDFFFKVKRNSVIL